MHNTNQTQHIGLFALFVLAVMGLAACGANETIEAGAPGETTVTTQDTAPEPTNGDDVAPDPAEGATEGFTLMTPRADLVSLQPTAPDQVLVDPENDQRLLIRFQGAAEPCSGAAVTVTETETAVTVRLETGLDPNAAAMSCIAQVFDYEIAVPLDTPLGDRDIRTEAAN